RGCWRPRTEAPGAAARERQRPPAAPTRHPAIGAAARPVPRRSCAPPAGRRPAALRRRSAAAGARRMQRAGPAWPYSRRPSYAPCSPGEPGSRQLEPLLRWVHEPAYFLVQHHDVQVVADGPEGHVVAHDDPIDLAIQAGPRGVIEL